MTARVTTHELRSVEERFEVGERSGLDSGCPGRGHGRRCLRLVPQDSNAARYSELRQSIVEKIMKQDHGVFPMRDSKKISVVLFLIVVLPFTMSTSIRVQAQVAGATLTGTISDSSGSAIPNADVSIKNVATGETRALTTDAAGFYTAPNLLPGKYEVTVTAPGFSTSVRSGITLTVGAQQLLNIPMKVGELSEKVEVTSEAPDLQLASSDISGVVSQTAVVELPLNGRDWTQLATLQPGVESVGSIQANTGTKDRAHRGYGVQMAISGSRPTQNNYRIDGISVNDYLNGGPGSVEGSTLGVDAVQEFSVLTSNYSTEYGRTSGGVVNAITKSGTNEFHGDAYEFLRNSALDARNYFDGATIPPFRRNQFGGAIGGRIWKDHTFFFATMRDFARTWASLRWSTSFLRR